MARRSFFKNGTACPDPADNGSSGAPKVHRGCQTCAHPERSRIEALFCAGTSLDKLASQFPPLRRDAIYRHCRSHVSDVQKVGYLAGPSAIADLANLAAQENRGIIDYASIQRSLLMHAMNKAAAEGKSHTLAHLSTPFLATLNFMAKLTGEMTELARTSINITNNSAVVMNSPLMAGLQTKLLNALQPFPEAPAAVIAALVELDDEHRQPETKLIDARAMEAAE